MSIRFGLGLGLWIGIEPTTRNRRIIIVAIPFAVIEIKLYKP